MSKRRNKRIINYKNVYIAKVTIPKVDLPGWKIYTKKTVSNVDQLEQAQQRIKNLETRTLDNTQQTKGNYSELIVNDQTILTAKILRKLGYKMKYGEDDFIKDKKY